MVENFVGSLCFHDSQNMKQQLRRREGCTKVHLGADHSTAPPFDLLLPSYLRFCGLRATSIKSFYLVFIFTSEIINLNRKYGI